MHSEREEPRRRALTAQVILRPASGRPSGPAASTNLAGALPDPATVREVQRFFEEAGFAVGDPIGTSFSLEGPLDAFVATFNQEPSTLRAALLDVGGDELELGHLPGAVRRSVEAVVLTAPPAFGPGNP